jgi:hypothetical protein
MRTEDCGSNRIYHPRNQNIPTTQILTDSNTLGHSQHDMPSPSRPASKHGGATPFVKQSLHPTHKMPACQPQPNKETERFRLSHKMVNGPFKGKLDSSASFIIF